MNDFFLFRKNGDIFTCAVVVQYNFSDGDQLPVLRDHLEQPPGSNVTLLWMNSSVGKLFDDIAIL